MASSFRAPEYLRGDGNTPAHRVRCPIHGFIRYSDNERRVVDHRLVRRLRHIRQLALTEYVYPGASHTRFEHSLGVMEVATKAFDSLAAKHGSWLDAVFGEVPRYSDETLARAREDLRLAALLHDTGHAPFSHAAESVLHDEAGHEQLSALVIQRPDLMGEVLDGLWGEGSAAQIALIYAGGPDLPPQLQVLHDLVAGEMDADRTDYLLRDSHHCGVDYGRFDHLRLIDCLELIEASGGLEIALHRDGIHAFEGLILARYQMNTQVYFHRIRRIYDHYLRQFFEAQNMGEQWPRDRVLAENDVTLLAQMRDAADRGQPGAEAARRIWERDHHRMVFQTGDDANAMDLRRAQEVYEAVRSRFGDSDVILDRAESKIHKLLVPDDQEDTGLVNLLLVHSRGRHRPVGEESQVLRRIDRSFQCARIFADPPLHAGSVRADIEAFAAEQWGSKGGR